MNFGEIKTRLTDVYGGKLTSDDALYSRCVNDAYHKVCSFNQWWWLETYTALTFSAPVVQSVPYTCVKGAATVAPVTAAGALTTAYDYGWFSTDENTYRISGVTAASPYTVTVDSAFLETSGSYTISAWNDTLTLPDDFDQAVAVAPRMDDRMKPLAHVPYEEIEAYGPDMSDQDLDVARCYSIYRETSIASGYRVRIWPPPDTSIDYILRYRQFPADLSADGDVPLVPAKHHSVLVDMSRLELLTVTGAEKIEVDHWVQQMVSGMNRMMRDASQRGKVKHRFGSYGSITENNLPFRLLNYTEGVDSN